MAYTKTEWKDQVVENPRTYILRDNGNGTTTLLDSFGDVTEIGTPVNAENMNHIENGIASVESSLQTQINQKANTSAVVTLTGTQSISGTKTFLAKTNMAPIELYPVDSGSPYIDFHYNNSTSDYTSRIIEQASGDLVVTANNFTINANGYARASDVNGSILTTVNKSKSANGYFKLGNGLIVQWGSAYQTATITLPTPFTSTNYKIAVAETETGHEYSPVVGNKTTTSFGWLSQRYGDWIAIGY